MTAALDADPRVGLAWCDMSIIDAPAGTTYRGTRAPIAGEACATIRPIYSSVTFLPSCTLFRARFFREGLHWEPALYPEDMSVFLHYAEHSHIVHVDDTLVRYRMHHGSQTGAPGAFTRNHPLMVATFRILFRRYRAYLSRADYRRKAWYLHHYAGDYLVRKGRSPGLSLIRALWYRPTALVSWKVLLQSLLTSRPRTGR